MAEFDPYATGWAPDPERAERNRRGAALCRSVLDLAQPGDLDGRARVLDPDDPRRDAALRRARLERGRRAAA